MENESKNVILVAYDFTPIGDIAIQNAVEMAKLLNYKVSVLHIINKTTKQNLKKANKPLESIQESLKEITEKIRKTDAIEIDFVAKEGSIFTAIADTARELQANFLIIGTHGKKGIQFLLGSFALKVIKSCPVPVIVVQKKAEQNTFKNIVFPLDLEPGSKQKVKWAIALHKQFKSKFHFIQDQYKDTYAHNKISADLNQVKKILDKHLIPYNENTKRLKGSFASSIIEYTKSIQGDMILLSTDPDKITWNLFGSTDERVIYNAEKIPVMCINAQDLKVIIGGL